MPKGNIPTWLYQTDSGIPVDPCYSSLPDRGYPNFPGKFPFVRGNYSGGYRDRLWTFRQYSGFGTARESNERYRYLLEQGGTGLSVALDLPSQCGYDSDDPDVEEEVGRVGVAIDTMHDLEILFDQIDLNKVSVSFTINGTAAIILAFFVATAEVKGFSRSELRGTIQNDILKEYASRGTWIWPPDPSLRLIGDTIEFCASDVPRFNAVSVAGAHFRDAGANAVQEMAFTLQDGVAYCDEVVSRGRLTIDEFAPQVSFFFYTHGDFFEEICKYRAGRLLWANIVKDRYGAKDERSSMFRVGCVCGGSSLYGPQPHNNIVRVAYEAMASVLGGVQSMFTAAWDEPFALPSEETTTLALRTQQILAYETGVARVADPLGGSYYVESLTDRMAERITGVMDDVMAHGGMVEAIESGYVQRLIAEEAFHTQQAVESGNRPVVGVNIFTTNSDPPDVEAYQLNEDKRAEQLLQLQEVKKRRNYFAVTQSLGELRKAATKDDINLMPLLIECARAYATVGEIVNVLKDVWGEYRQPAVF